MVAGRSPRLAVVSDEGEIHDFIVVGAGSAGCVLAARLSEGGSHSVLLVEAGPDLPEPARRPPLLRNDYGTVAVDSSYAWSYPGRFTQAQGTSPVARGRIVGGSGAINGAMFVRGLPEDYDGWGLPEWSAAALEPAFRRAEEAFTVTLHRAEERLPFHEAFRRAALGAGFTEKPDIGVPEGSGVGAIRLNSADGARVSAADSHLAGARGRPNLSVLTEAQARRVVVEQGRAVGLELQHDDRVRIVRAREIILCAGGIGSPHLLLVSGVGPADRLRSAGIRPVHDLPGVGGNLKDHPIAVVDAEPDPRCRPRPDHPRFQVLLQYTTAASPRRNDMHLFPSSVAPEEGDPMAGLAADSEAWRIYAAMQTVSTSGRISLVSPDPLVPPCIEFGYLEEPLDRARLREAVRLGVRLLEHPAFEGIVARRRTPPEEALASDDALDEWLRSSLASAQHTSGTCRLGSSADPAAVVDAHCRVRGIAGLRVADLSIAPDVVRAPTQATAMMIGERAAELMLGDELPTHAAHGEW